MRTIVVMSTESTIEAIVEASVEPIVIAGKQKKNKANHLQEYLMVLLLRKMRTRTKRTANLIRVWCSLL